MVESVELVALGIKEKNNFVYFSMFPETLN